MILIFLACGLSLGAQNSTKNSWSVTAGPNWFFQFSKQDNAQYSPNTGFTAGLDYARSFTPHWQLWVLGRYNIWNSTSKLDNLQWPSEWQNGAYMPDPNLPHSIELDHTDKTWQLMAGIRYSGQPGIWRWYADAGAGMTQVTGSVISGNTSARFTLGMGAGLEWLPPARHFGLFVQPGARYVFKLNNSPVDYHFLALALETGVRWHF